MSLKIELWKLKTPKMCFQFPQLITQKSENWVIYGNKNQTDFSTMGPTIFELWVMETELWIIETANPNSPLTSHLHLCGLTFVHPLINVAGLLYIIIEKKMNPILFFRSSYFSKPISLCWLLSTCPTSSFNELSKRVGWTCRCRHPTHCGWCKGR